MYITTYRQNEWRMVTCFYCDRDHRIESIAVRGGVWQKKCRNPDCRKEFYISERSARRIVDVRFEITSRRKPWVWVGEQARRLWRVIR